MKQEDKYLSLLELQDSLIRLCEIFGYSISPEELQVPGKFRRSLDRYANRGADIAFISKLGENVDKAVETLKKSYTDKSIDTAMIDQLRQTIDEYEIALRERSDEIEKLKQQILAESEKNKRVLQGSEEKSDISKKSDMLTVIEDIIELRDKQILKRDYLESLEGEDNTNALKIIGSTLRSTAEMLERMGVEILDEEGDFSPSEQVAVETQFTDDDTLVGKIAKTVRAGYRYLGRSIRAQEVIIYVKEK